MTIKLYSNISEVNAVNKSITEIATITGVLREETSIIDPVIVAISVILLLTAFTSDIFEYSLIVKILHHL